VTGRAEPDPPGLRGELEAGRGRDGAAIAPLERALAVIRNPVGGPTLLLARPRALLLLARSYQRTGDRRRARERLDELLAWKGADPDLPVLREALALRAELGATPGRP
jgi:hypothetical protein